MPWIRKVALASLATGAAAAAKLLEAEREASYECSERKAGVMGRPLGGVAVQQWTVAPVVLGQRRARRVAVLLAPDKELTTGHRCDDATLPDAMTPAPSPEVFLCRDPCWVESAARPRSSSLACWPRPP